MHQNMGFINGFFIDTSMGLINVSGERMEERREHGGRGGSAQHMATCPDMHMHMKELSQRGGQRHRP